MTCFRETLSGFRTSLETIRELKKLFGAETALLGSVPGDWLELQALVPGRIEVRWGALVNVDEPGLRSEFERQHADLLVAHGMEHLDIAEVRSRNRVVTRTLSRWCFARGAAGIVYRSNLDDLPCAALFEGRASIVNDGEPELLTGTPAELLEVCSEFGLTLG